MIDESNPFFFHHHFVPLQINGIYKTHKYQYNQSINKYLS